MRIWSLEQEAANLKERFSGVRNRAAFARDFRVPGGQAMIYQHINGIKPISMDAGLAYAAAFGCDLRDISQRLADEAETISKGMTPNILPGITIDSNRRGYPIISYVQAGAWREIVDSFPRGGADEYILANSSYGPHTFALRIVGNSMEPEFKEGDVVVIDPDVNPDPGNYVVARNHEESATFKKYRPRGVGADGLEIFELVPLNPDYAVLRSDQQPIQIIGTMVEHTRFRR
jgi:SOS-response transcriptional repressor LexA